MSYDGDVFNQELIGDGLPDLEEEIAKMKKQYKKEVNGQEDIEEDLEVEDEVQTEEENNFF